MTAPTKLRPSRASGVLLHPTSLPSTGGGGEFGIGEGAVNHDQLIRDKVALYDRYGLGRSWWEYQTTRPFSAVDDSGAWRRWVDLLLPGGAGEPLY